MNLMKPDRLPALIPDYSTQLLQRAAKLVVGASTDVAFKHRPDPGMKGSGRRIYGMHAQMNHV